MKLSLVNCCLFVDKFKPMYITTVDFSCMILEFSDMIFVSKDQARPKRHRGRPKLEFISSNVLPCKYFSSCCSDNHCALTLDSGKTSMNHNEATTAMPAKR